MAVILIVRVPNRPSRPKTMLTNLLVIEANRFESTAQELGGSTVSDPKAQ
jgi:hypothetical protein